MTAIRSALRRRSSSRDLDVQLLRQLTRDGRLWCLVGRVFEPEGQPHFRVVEDGGRIVDVLVEVLTGPTKQDLTCRLATWAGGPGAGAWYVPPVGAEVLVAIPEGAIDFVPTVVGVLSTQDVPRGRDGNPPGPDRFIVVSPVPVEWIAPQHSLGPRVELQGTGLGKAIKDYVDHLKSSFLDVHVHGGVSTGLGTSGTPVTPAPAAPQLESGTVKVSP